MTPAIDTDGNVIHLRKPPAKGKATPKPAIHRAPVYQGGQFSLQVENTRTGEWLDMTSLMTSCSLNETVADCAVDCRVSLSNIRTPSGYRIGNFIRRGTNIRMFYADSPTAPMREMHRFRVWDRTADGEPKLDLLLYDHLMHLKQSDCVVLYSTSKSKKVAWTVSEIHKHFCKKFGIPMGHVPKSKVKVPYLFHDGSMYDFLVKLWTLDMEQTKKKWIIRMAKGRLTVMAKTAKGIMWELSGYESSDGRGIGNLIKSTYSVGIHEELATAITVRGTSRDGDGKQAAVVVYAENKVLLNQIGRIHKVIKAEGVTSRARARKIAATHIRLRAHDKVSASVEALGIPFLRAGDPVWARDHESGLIGRFYCGTVSKNISSDGSFTMSVGMNWLDIVPKIKASPDDLRQAEKDDGTSTATGMPTWLRNTLKRAAGEVGVPESWADGKSLAKLLQHESGFKPTAQNPTSTAYGLFQFLDTTWANYGFKKTSDPYMQCVAGLTYIKKRYGTPEKAWRFWQANNWY